MIAVFDIVGAVFSFFSTVSYVRVNILAWPLGLTASVIGIALYWHQGIYGDMSLHCLYLLLSCYGWYQWKFGGKNHKELPITSLNLKTTAILIPIALGCFALLFWLLHNYTNSQIPLLDATTTTLGLMAQWLICRKIIQCWPLWFIVDGMYTATYLYKGLPAHSILQIIYMGMAIAGYLVWTKKRLL